MKYKIFVQNPAERRFVASVIEMPAVSEEGTTEEEAVSRAKAALEAQLAKGKIINIELPQTTTIELDPTNKTHSPKFSMRYAGIFADDPSFEDWEEKLALIRCEANAEIDE